jgi:hypothetical protein
MQASYRSCSVSGGMIINVLKAPWTLGMPVKRCWARAPGVSLSDLNPPVLSSGSNVFHASSDHPAFQLWLEWGERGGDPPHDILFERPRS